MLHVALAEFFRLAEFPEPLTNQHTTPRNLVAGVESRDDANRND